MSCVDLSSLGQYIIGPELLTAVTTCVARNLNIQLLQETCVKTNFKSKVQIGNFSLEGKKRGETCTSYTNVWCQFFTF